MNFTKLSPKICEEPTTRYTHAHLLVYVYCSAGRTESISRHDELHLCKHFEGLKTGVNIFWEIRSNVGLQFYNVLSFLKFK